MFAAAADRPIFLFYAVMMLPFMVVTVALVCGRLIGRSRAPTPRRTAGVVVAGSFLVLVLLNFAWCWPIHTNQLLTRSEWLDRVWFERWICGRSPPESPVVWPTARHLGP